MVWLYCGTITHERPWRLSMKFHPALLGVLLCCVGVSMLPAADESASAAAAVTWLKENAIPLKSVSPGQPVADLAPLQAVVGNARLVALGEATHGTHEFFQLKLRLIQYLVTEMGFNTIALEANMPEARLVDQYIQTGQGDPVALAHGLGFWAWDTQEMADAFRWMRGYKQSGRGALHFTGFDVQHPEAAIAGVRDAVAAKDEAYAPTVEAAALQKEPKLATAAWAEIAQHLTATRDRYGADADWIAQQARLVRMSWQAKSKEVSRDRSMAANIKWTLDQNPKARMVIWTHNGHASLKNIRGYDPMGQYLREEYGAQAVLFGSAFLEGSFQAMTSQGMHIFQVPATPDGSLDATLAATGLPVFAVDLRKAPASGPVHDWLHTPHHVRSAGGTYTENAPLNDVAPAECFDVLLFVRDSTSAHPNGK